MTSKVVSQSISCPIGPADRQERIDTGIVTRQGTLMIKLPPSERSSSWKAWTKRHVILKSDIIASVDRITNSVCVCVYKGEKKPAKNMKDEELIFKRWFTPDNTAIFRSKSRTQHYGFSICVSAETIIHIGGKSETEAQEWMASIRVLLWPPNNFIQLEKTLGSVFEVSIIDNEHAYRAGLLGMYGHLTVTSRKVILTHPQTGHVIQEWYLDTVGFKLLPQAHPDDRDKVLTMLTESKSSTGSGAIIFFCSSAAQLIERVHEVRLMFDDKSYGEQTKCDLENLSLNSSYSRYKKPVAHVAKSADSDKMFLDIPKFKFARPVSESDILDVSNDDDEIGPLKSFPMLSRSPHNGTGAKNKLFSWSNVANIPETMLNSSIASTAMFRTAAHSRPLSEASSSNGSSPRLNEQYEGSDEHEQFHAAIARENEQLEQAEINERLNGEATDIPPPLPPKKQIRSLRKATSTID